MMIGDMRWFSKYVDVINLKLCTRVPPRNVKILDVKILHFLLPSVEISKTVQKSTKVTTLIAILMGVTLTMGLVVPKEAMHDWIAPQ